VNEDQYKNKLRQVEGGNDIDYKVNKLRIRVQTEEKLKAETRQKQKELRALLKSSNIAVLD